MAENKKGNNGEVKIVEEKGFFAKVKEFPKNFKEKHPKATARIEKAAIAVACIGAGVVGDRLFNRFGGSDMDVIDTDDYMIEDAGVDNFNETSNI